MWDWLTMELWSPYVVGVAIGVLSWLAFLFSDKHISCSTALTRSSGMVEKLFRGKKVTEKPYYKKFSPTVQWDWMLLVGVFLGALLSAWLSGSIDVKWVPVMWEQAFGGAALPRLIAAFIGGIFMGFGSRWANGCTSGHGISGALQLAVSSWISVVFFFAGGILTALLIYRVIGA